MMMMMMMMNLYIECNENRKSMLVILVFGSPKQSIDNKFLFIFIGKVRSEAYENITDVVKRCRTDKYKITDTCQNKLLPRYLNRSDHVSIGFLIKKRQTPFHNNTTPRIACFALQFHRRGGFR